MHGHAGRACAGQELLEMLSNFLGVRPEQNLRELPYPISSYRKLKEPRA